MAASVILSFLTSGASKVMGALAGLGKAAGGLMKGLGALGQGMKKMAPAGLALTGVFAGLTYAIMSIGKSILATGQTFDGFRAKFKALYKDITRATEAMNEAIEIAARTPFKVQDVVDVFGAFKAVGLDPTSMLNGKVVMEDMADLAYGMGRSLQDAQWAIKEAAAEGNWRSLMMRFSISKDQIMSTLEAANITPDLSNPTKALETIRKYIQLQFGGTMEAMANTVEVKISNIGDQFNQFKDLIYTSGVSDALVGVLDKVLKGLQSFFQGETGQAWAKSIGATFKLIIENLSRLAPLGKAVLGAIWSMFTKILSATVRTAVVLWRMGEPVREIYKWTAKLTSTFYRMTYLSIVLTKRMIMGFNVATKGTKESVGLLGLVRRILEQVFDATMEKLRFITGLIEKLNRHLAFITGEVTDMSEEEKEAGSVWNELIDAVGQYKGAFDDIDWERQGSGLEMMKSLMGGLKEEAEGVAEATDQVAENLAETSDLTAAQRADYIDYRKNIIKGFESLSESAKALEKLRGEWRKIAEEQINVVHGVEDMIDGFREAKGLLDDQEKNAKGLARQQELLAAAQERQDLKAQSDAYKKMADIVKGMLKEEADLQKTIREAKDPREAFQARRRLEELRKERGEAGVGDLGSLEEEIVSGYGGVLEALKKQGELAQAEIVDKVGKAEEDLKSKAEGMKNALDAMREFAYLLGEKFNPKMLETFNASLDRFGLHEDKLETMGIFFDNVNDAISRMGALAAGAANIQGPTMSPELWAGTNRYGEGAQGGLYAPNQRLLELQEQQLEEQKKTNETLTEAKEEARNPVSPSKSDDMEAFTRQVKTLPMF